MAKSDVPATVNKPRSPNYPRSSLSGALNSTEQLYKKAGKNVVDDVTAVRTFGYKGMSGPSRARLSSMRKYGLIELAQGGVRVAPLAIRIFQPMSEDERESAKYEAATTPALFKKLAEDYRDADESVTTAYLVRIHEFTPGGARHAVRIFRENMAFVKAPGEIYNDSPDAPEDSAVTIGPRGDTSWNAGGGPPRVTPGTSRTVQVPISETTWATLQAPFPLTEEAWNQMLAVLRAMKPGLVAKPSEPAVPASSSAEDGSR